MHTAHHHEMRGGRSPKKERGGRGDAHRYEMGAEGQRRGSYGDSHCHEMGEKPKEGDGAGKRYTPHTTVRWGGGRSSKEGEGARGMRIIIRGGGEGRRRGRWGDSHCREMGREVRRRRGGRGEAHATHRREMGGRRSPKKKRGLGRGELP